MKFIKGDKEKLIIGEIYTVTWNDYKIILKYNSDIPNDPERINALYIFVNKKDLKSSTPYLTDRDVEPASFEDKQWLLQSIEKGHYISKEQIKLDYELY